MTLPNPVIPGASILSTRRTIGGRFHYSPNPAINRIVQFALAYTAAKHGIGLYSYCALSNHHHMTFHDPLGRHPIFRQELHSLLTRSSNHHRGESEAKWSPDRQSPVLLADLEAVLDSTAYTIANSSRHDLVESPEDWPGFVSLVDDLATGPVVVRKPKGFYDPNGDMPDQVKLEFIKPPILEAWSNEEYREELRRRVEEKCWTAARARARKGTKIVGVQRILGQSPNETPRNDLPTRSLSPRVACKNRTLRVAILIWLRNWRHEHRDSRRAFESGSKRIVFPFGTYLHALRYGVNCSTVGPPQVLQTC